ncbi:MAG: hypothetical protein GC179_22245 [Anaerolineaceae bacterium]|nr:hypothetical protein [Anaerolineaceae bacterium]
MDNQTAIGLLSLCGIVAVLILLGSFLLIRIMKSSIFGVANMVLRSVTDPTEVKTTTVHTQTVQRPDFRSAAKSVDFDAAVASHKGEVNPSVHTNPTTPSDLNATAFTTTHVTTPSTSPSTQRKRIRRQHVDDEEDGEIFEGLLGD